jgi:predicted transcriptional regulator
MSTPEPTSPLDDQDAAAFAEAVQEWIADAEAERTISYEKIRRWLLSWGTDSELPPPECR